MTKKISGVMLTVLIIFIADCRAYELGDVHIHGFVSQGYLQSDRYSYLYADTEDGTFQFNEVGLNFISELTDQLRLGIQFLARDLGRDGNNEVGIDWAFGDYLWKNGLGLRAGILKIPFGLYNENRDVDMARSCILLPRSIYNETERALFAGLRGAGIYGELPYGFSYQFLLGELDDGKIKDRAERSGRELDDVDTGLTYAAQILWETPLDGLMLGGSIYDISGLKTSRDIVMGPPGTPAVTLLSDHKIHYSWVASLEYSFYDVKFFTEYYQSHVKIDMDLIGVHVDAEEQAWYAGASYRFTDWFELGGYYSEYYEDKSDRDGDSYKARGEPAAKAWLKEFVLSTRFDIGDYWIFKLEGHIMDGLNGVDYSGETDPSEDGFLFAAKVSFSF